MSIRLDERRYVEELKRLVADFRMWKNPLVPLPDGFEDDLAWSNVAFLITFFQNQNRFPWPLVRS